MDAKLTLYDTESKQTIGDKVKDSAAIRGRFQHNAEINAGEEADET